MGHQRSDTVLLGTHAVSPESGNRLRPPESEPSDVLRARRLLFVINDLDFFVSHRLPIAIAARQASMEVRVAAAPSPAEARLHAEGIGFDAVPVTRSGAHLVQELRVIWRLFRLFRSWKPDIVHSVTIKAVLYGGLAARFARVPALVSAISGLGHVFIQRGFRAALARTLVMRGYRIALSHPRSRVIFQNPDDRATFLRARAARDHDTVLIRGSGVSLDAFRPVLEPPGPVLLVLASRMLSTKGVGDFVAAAVRLKAQGVDARFALVGPSDPHNPAGIPEIALRAWQSGGHVEWWGRRDDMPKVFAQAHVVCLPTVYGEGVPKVLIEAAACGRPIVATDVPGCREVVQNEVNGLLVPPGNVEALCHALKRLIDDAALRREMGRQGRELAERHFSLADVVQKTLAVYRDLLD